ncbi:mechanosensitive ion channel family protein [Candidatus Spongiihabitans sp.]|uniref:mechanosensitive ion channel family protein n=1 Tax=Candidatus Spongiihabitans sp. TaxID=3101308 RepID=UPI003C7C1CC7
MNLLDQFISSFGDNIGQVYALLVLLATLMASLLSRVVVSRLTQYSRRSATLWDDAFAQSLGAPLRVLLWVVGLSIAVDLALVNVDAAFAKMISPARDLGIIVAIAWFLIRFIKRAQSNVIAKKTAAGEHIDKAAVDVIGKVSRLIVVIVAFLVAMQTLGFSIAGVLTFGGVGGIAIGFAAKDLLSNFFGGFIIYLDRPFSEGEWISSPDRDIEGSVEQIGWRVTRIRKFDSRPLYVPNSVFATIAIENPSRMSNRRIYETIGIRYEDAGTMENIVAQVTAYLKAHAEIDQERTIMVNFTTFAASSLDFFVYCFTKTQTGVEFYRIKQEILLHILKIIEDNNAECAFPTTTVHLQSDDGAPA